MNLSSINIVAANPTGTISGAAVNGSATTFMRSDAAPALSLTLAQLNAAVSDANVPLVETNTWTPSQGAGLTVVGAFSSSGVVTKIDRLVTISGRLAGATSIAVNSNGTMTANLQFVPNVATGPQLGICQNNNSSTFLGVYVYSDSKMYLVGGNISATITIDFYATYYV